MYTSQKAKKVPSPDFFLKSCTHLTRNGFIKLYKALVRPHLEYGNAIWHPRLKRQSTSVEKVQRMILFYFGINSITRNTR